MEVYFTFDTISNILEYLDKDDSFNFLNMAKFMKPSRKILYGKYAFDHNKMDNSIRQYIRKLKCSDIADIVHYKNLVLLTIHNCNFVREKNYVKFPESIKSLTLWDCEDSNYPYYLKILPKSLQSLTIISWTFNNPIYHLPDTLQSLTIRGYGFDQSIDNLPNSLESLGIHCSRFNQPINHLPESLQSLEIICNRFNQTIDFLPYSLQSLKIVSNAFKQSLVNLPKHIKYDSFL